MWGEFGNLKSAFNVLGVFAGVGFAGVGFAGVNLFVFVYLSWFCCVGFVVWFLSGAVIV